MDSGLAPPKSAFADVGNNLPISGKPEIGGAPRNDGFSNDPLA